MIAEREGMPADDEALELVARRGGGSMRDAESLLDQLLAFGGDRLTADQVRQLLGLAGDDRVLALAEAVVAKDAGQALALLDETVQGGLQMGELVDQLVAYWRDLMVIHCAGDQARDLSVPSRCRPDLERQAKALTLDAVLAGLDVLSATRDPAQGQQPRPDARGNGPGSAVPAQRPLAGGAAGPDDRRSGR